MLGTITLTVGQPDGGTVAPKEEAPENMDTLPDEVTPQLNGEKLDKESPEANSLSSVEVKSTEEKGEDPGEVGFKKIFTIVGLKFTVKKDKSEETDPVKLLTVKDKDGEEVSETDEPTKEKETETEEEDSKTETMETEKETSTSKEPEKAETPDGTSAEASIEGAKAEGAKTEGAKTEEVEKESETPPTPKETISPFRKLFFVGLFSNLRKKSSLRRMKEEEEAAKANETAEAKEENDVKEEKTKEENAESEQEVKSEASATPVEEQLEPKEEATTPPKEEKSDTAAEAPAETSSPTDTTDESKPEDQKAEAAAKDEAAPAEVTSEAELQSSQEKTKIHGSPLKKLFTGSGLKKLSTKRQKSKKDTGEQLQSSTESEEGPKAESGPSSPESPATGEPVTEGNQNESSQETEGEVASDGEKKKDSVIASFRKLVTPKKHAKRLSDSDDEATSDKPAKSATLSSSESAPLAEKGDEEETKEEKVPEEEPKTDNSEKLTTSTEEAKKKMDTSVSWEALMCMGGPKKRTRKTSDSDDDETKAEEEAPAAVEAAAAEEEGGQEEKIEPAAITPQETESEAAAAPAPEPVSAPPVRESPWATLKRLVASKNKPKVEVKPESSAEQVQPEAEAPKEESSFSLKKLFPGRKKKVVEKPPSPEQEEDSETPAVVPLSEYDDQTPAEQVSPEETAEVQNKVSAEDRTPSWIPASVEDADDRRDQLSDITEEAENAATPKSIDTDNTEDDTDDIVPPPNRGNMGRRLSTAEVKPITPAPDASTSPVPKSPETESAVETLGRIKPQISEVPFQTCVTVEDPPVNVATVAIEQEPETDIIESTTKTFLEAHKRSDATAICIGLETKESVDPPVEEPVEPTVESAPALKSAQTTELAVQEKSDAVEEASVSEDAVFNAHVHQVQILELERVAEDLAIQGAEIQAARESFESEIEKIGVVSIENSEVIQPVTLKENSPKAVAVDPISPTLESTPCSQSAEVSEVTVESKEKHVSTEKLSATGENTPVRAMLQVVAGEATPNNRKGGETAITAIVPSEESAVMMDTVVLVAPEEKATSSVSKASMSDTFVSAKKMSRKVKEEVHRDKEIENRSAEIAQTVIQDAVDKVSEDGPTGNNADKPGSLIPTPVKAIATTEKEVEVATEPVVITDTPSPVLCKKTVKKAPVQLCVATEVTESIPIEVIETLEGEKGVGKEKKLEKRLKTAEIKVSEETVVEEEVGEIGGKREKSKKGDGGKTQPEEKKAIHMPIQVVLQEAEEVEEPPVEVEVTSELNGESSPSAKNPPRIKKLSSLSEEPQVPGSEEAAGCNQDTETTGSKSSVKCAEVMAQVIEVIEEAVKEIEPMSTELTAAS